MYRRVDLLRTMTVVVVVSLLTAVATRGSARALGIVGNDAAAWPHGLVQQPNHAPASHQKVFRETVTPPSNLMHDRPRLIMRARQVE